jgi:hypothetical protein
MEKKVCTKCGEEKVLTEFNKNKRQSDNFSPQCKLCRSAERKKYYSKNKTRELEKIKEYQVLNKDSISNQRKKYRKDNRKVLSAKHKDYIKQRKLIDPIFKLKERVRSKIRKSLSKFKSSKQLKTIEILGCDHGEFKSHIESQFELWMTWDNYGLYNGKLNFGWDLDHIIPLSSAVTKEDVFKLNHYTNFQPLCSHINRNVKKNSLTWKS